MARVLAYTSPPAGHVFPAVPMLLELARRGHSVELWTASKQVGRLRAAGLDAHAVDPRIEAVPVDDWRRRSAVGALGRLLRTFERRAPVEVGELRELIARSRPDALVVDVNCLGAQVAAEASRIPWAVYCPHPPALRARGTPPFGPGLAPGSRARDALVGACSDRVYNRVLGTVNALRRTAGLQPVAHVHAQQYLRAHRTVCFTAEPFEYPRARWPDGFRLVGPALWEPPAEASSWSGPDGEPVVLVTASTAYQGDERLIETALAALADEPVRVVATTAAHDPARFRAPANAVVQRFVPHSDVLGRAACVVTHGGMGITQKALARGVPVCVVPFARDQFEVARRVEVCGAGERLPARRLSARRLRAAVRVASGRRAGAERVADAFARAGGARAAADAVEGLAR